MKTKENGKSKEIQITFPNISKIPYRMKLKDTFTLSDEGYELWNIPKMTIDDPDHQNELEIWTFCKFSGKYKNFTKERRYIVSTYARVYDLNRKRLVGIVDATGWSKNSAGIRYKKVNVIHDYMFQTNYFLHRLVAMAFIDQPQGKDVVDHIDENPSHNYVWNLQWMDKSGNSNKHNMYVNRDRNGKAVDTSWKYEELEAICKMMAEGHKATYIYNEMLKLTNNDPKIQYERIRTLYKHIMRRGDFHDIAVKCGVKFESNTLKEKGSVAKVQSEKEEKK